MPGFLKNLLAALAALQPLLLVVTPLTAQQTVYQGEKTTLSVQQFPGDTYSWELYSDASVNFAVVPGNCPLTSARFVSGSSGPSVNVEWLQPGIYFYKVTARDVTLCTQNFKLGMIRVMPSEVEALITGVSLTGACKPITLDASSSKGIIETFNWSVLDPGLELSTTTGPQTDLRVTQDYITRLPAEFRVVLKITGLYGKTDSDTITIKIDPLPVAEIYSSGKVEKDATVVFDGSVSKGISLQYYWYTTMGSIIGPDDQPKASLRGTGLYSLEVTDAYGCYSEKKFEFPANLYQTIANDDYARTSWAKDTTISVLDNDLSTAPLIKGSVRVLRPPFYGNANVGSDGRITYVPGQRKAGRDEFTYKVCDEVNLCDTALVTVDIYDEYITAPEGFSPNGDGNNDYLIFNGLEHYPFSRLYIYTRAGLLVYSSDNYQNDWDGIPNQNMLKGVVNTGVYYYVLELGDTGRRVKGFIYVGY